MTKIKYHKRVYSSQRVEVRFARSEEEAYFAVREQESRTRRNRQEERKRSRTGLVRLAYTKFAPLEGATYYMVEPE